jgi:hypothetical protein
MHTRDADRLLNFPADSIAKCAMKPIMPINRKAEWVAHIEFIFAECLRIKSSVENALKTNPASLRDLPREDHWGDLPHPDGKGTINCGRAGNQRIWRLAEEAIRCSDAIGTIEIAPVHKALGRILVHRFLTQHRPIDELQAERALASAVKEAKRDRRDRTHHVPCRLMYNKGPSSFAIGPVTFHAHERFSELMTPHFDAYLAEDREDWQKAHSAGLLDDAKHYYEGFTWVGEVKIINCDDGTSRARARMAVTGAVNFVHVLFGSYHTRRMDIGGPRLETDRRAHLFLDPKDGLVVSLSTASTSAVGFPDDWQKMLEGEDMAHLLRGAQKALETVVDPAIKRTMGSRLLDSAAWFGEAVREESPAAQIIKAVTALERLVMTFEHDEIKKTVSQRGAAIRFEADRGKSFTELANELAEAYPTKPHRPPCTGSIKPVMYDARDESRNMMHSAISPGVASRFRRMCRLILTSSSSEKHFAMSVSVVPGETALTRIPESTSSRANPRVMASTPALAAA